MNKIENFRKFFEKSISSGLQQLEVKRKGIQNRIILTVGAFTILMPCLGFGIVIVSGDPTFLIYFIPVFVIAAVFFYALYDALIRNTSYYKAYKDQVISKIINYIEPKLKFDNREMIAKGDYYHSQIFDKVDLDFEGDDRVSGLIDGVNVEFSELKTMYKNKKDRVANDDNKYQFRGIFFVADCPNPFPVDLVVSPKGKEKKGGLQIDTNNIEFNEKFVVKSVTQSSKDDIDNFLNNEILTRILSLSNKLHNDIYISFIESSMYVAIAHDKDLFEPTIWNSNLNFDATFQHFQDLYFPISIIESLAIHKDISAMEEDELERINQ